MLNIRERSDGVTIECRITPRASRNAIKGVKEGVLQVALNAPPLEGRANEALTEFISEKLRIPRSRISIIGGEHSRNKVMLIQGTNKDAIVTALKPAEKTT
jgi:uncharacterized protein